MERKRITLHPVLDDGTVDTNVNLYPKTLLKGIVDDTGEEVEVALKDELSNYVTTEDADQVILGNKRFLHSIEANALKLYNGEDYDTRIFGNASGGVSLLSNGEFKTLATTNQLPTNYVTTDTEQDIRSIKTFKDPEDLHLNNEVTIDYTGIRIDGSGSGEPMYGFYGANRISGKDEDDDLFILWFPKKKSGTIALTSDVEENKGTKLYRHHFDIVIGHDDLALIPQGSAVAINVNALSTSGTAWQTLSELDGGGYIVSALGNIPNNYSYIFELKIYYNALGTLLLNIHDLTDNTVKAVAVTTVGGGQTPSTFALQDSVTPL